MLMRSFKLATTIINSLPFKSLEKIKHKQSMKTKRTALDPPRVEQGVRLFLRPRHRDVAETGGQEARNLSGRIVPHSDSDVMKESLPHAKLSPIYTSFYFMLCNVHNAEQGIRSETLFAPVTNQQSSPLLPTERKDESHRKAESWGLRKQERQQHRYFIRSMNSHPPLSKLGLGWAGDSMVAVRGLFSHDELSANPRLATTHYICATLHAASPHLSSFTHQQGHVMYLHVTEDQSAQPDSLV